MKHKKKLFRMLVNVILSLCILIMSITQFGCIQPNESNGLQYEVDKEGNTCTITGIGEYKGVDVVIPEKIGDFTVVAIGDAAFKDCSSIETVQLPETVVAIGEEAFLNCFSLTDINIPHGVKVIAREAFCSCVSLERIELPANLQQIADGAFAGCVSLIEIDLPDKLTTLGSAVFFMCNSLIEVEWPSSLTNFGSSPFGNCSSLNNIYVDERHPFLMSVEGVLFTKDNKYIAAYPSGKMDVQYIIPKGTQCIESLAFSDNNNLVNIVVPDTVVYIYSAVIYNSANLKSISYEGAVEEWCSISKNPDWDAGSADYTIYCTDGEIAKDGTVTYK